MSPPRSNLLTTGIPDAKPQVIERYAMRAAARDRMDRMAC